MIRVVVLVMAKRIEFVCFFHCVWFDATDNFLIKLLRKMTWRASGRASTTMQALVDEISQGIIHKAMARHAGPAVEHWRGNAHPEMGAAAAGVGAHMQ